MTTPPPWHPDADSKYDDVLAGASQTELAVLQSGSAAAAEEFMRDTRAVHSHLYAPLVPVGFPEYAGTYRGTPGTSLEHRTVGANFVTKPGQFYFLAPEKVARFMAVGLKSAIDELIAASPSETSDQLFHRAAKVFYVFGLIHPYLDGNGHIQRLIFAAAVAQHPQLALSSSWTSHPRPYDVEMPEAFEATPGALDAVAAVLSPYVDR